MGVFQLDLVFSPFLVIIGMCVERGRGEGRGRGCVRNQFETISIYNIYRNRNFVALFW